MTFKRVNDFSTDPGDEAKLDRELSQLEDNVAAETSEIRAQYALQMTLRTFVARGSLTITDARPGEQLSLDTAQASAAVVFPPIVSANFGRRFVLIKRAAANSVVCGCSDPTVLFNGAAAPTLSAVGSKVFYCDATGYYS